MFVVVVVVVAVVVVIVVVVVDISMYTSLRNTNATLRACVHHPPPTHTPHPPLF